MAKTKPAEQPEEKLRLCKFCLSLDEAAKEAAGEARTRITFTTKAKYQAHMKKEHERDA